jgi:hypothetical protein
VGEVLADAGALLEGTWASGVSISVLAAAVFEVGVQAVHQVDGRLGHRAPGREAAPHRRAARSRGT